MQRSAPSLNRSHRSRGNGEHLGSAGSRNRSRPALAVLVAFLLALCAWLITSSGRPAIEGPEASATVAPRVQPRDAPPPKAIRVATEPADRTAVAELGSPDLPSLAVAEIARPDTLVYGSLLDPSYGPILDTWSAGVSFVDHTGLRLSSDAKQEGGAYALHALGFGTYWVTASADGYRSLEEIVDLRADRPQMRKDFTLQKAVELRVRVITTEGKNLLDVLEETGAPRGARLLVPVATLEPPGKRFDELAGSLNSKFGVGQFQDYGPRVEGLSPDCMGILLLDCDRPVWVSLLHYHVVLQTKRVGTGQDEVTFVLSPGDLLANLATIRVHVIDSEAGLPIQHARVMLTGGTYFDQGVATDPQGIATIERREPGLFDLQVWAKGYEGFRKSIDALPGEITDLGTVTLEREVAVAGNVLDPEGNPLAASFSVGVLDPVDHAIHWFRQEGFKSGGDGSFEIRRLGRGEYVIRTSNHDAVNEGEWEGIVWVSGNVLVDTRAGPISGLEVRLRPASKLVLQVARGAADGMRFRVVDERGLELVESILHGSEPRPLELPPGSYRVSLLDPRGNVLSERSVTLESETVELVFPR